MQEQQKQQEQALKSRSVSPLQAAVVLLFYAALLVLWLWARAQMTGVPTPTQMKALPDGTALVSFEHQLYAINADGSVAQGLSLPLISNAVGIAAHDADAVFVYQGGEKRVGFMDHLRTFLRAEQPTAPPEMDEGIYLCRLSQESCDLFSSQFVVTGSARLLWDAARAQLIVADTGAHVLRVLDSRGQLVKTISGFHYPNGIWQSGAELLVADTNHHRIAAVNLVTLAAPQTLVKIHPDREHVWPSGVAQVGGEYWVLAADNNMGNSRLYRYDAHWQLLGQAATSLGDIVNLVPFGTGALVIDMASRSLWQINAAGTAVTAVMLPGMQQAQADYRYWRALSYGLLALLVLAVVAGFAYALWDERRHKQAAAAEVAVDAATAQASPHITLPAVEVWIEPGGMVRRRHWLWLPPFVMIGIGLWLFDGTMPDLPVKSELKLGLGLTIFFLVACSTWLLMNYVGRSALGVKGARVLLRTPDGREVMGEGAEIRYSNSLLVIKDVIMPLGDLHRQWSRKKEGLWKQEQLQKVLLPALQGAQKMRAWESVKLIWRLRFWPLLSTYALIVLIALLMLGVLIAKQQGAI